jgi:hypothetical protein
MRGGSIKDKARGEWTTELPQPLDRQLPTAVVADLQAMEAGLTDHAWVIEEFISA